MRKDVYNEIRREIKKVRPSIGYIENDVVIDLQVQT